MTSRNISVRLQVEGGQFKAELVDAGRTGSQALKQIEVAARDTARALGETSTSAQKADREQEKLARSAERLKRQYADGYAAAQEQARASQLVTKGLLTQSEYASVVEGIGRRFTAASTGARSFGQAVEQQSQQVRVTARQLAQLQPQLNDIFTQLTTGQSPLTVALQQGPQITQIFGGLGATLRAIPPVALGVAAAFTAVGVPLTIIGARAADLAAQSRSFNVALAAMGRQSEVTAEQLGQLVDRLRDAGIARDEARGAITALVRTPTLSAANIPRLAGLVPDFAAATGTSASDAARQLAEFATGGYDAIIKLDRALGSMLAPSQREQIRLLAQQGDRTRAFQIAVDALEQRIRGLNREALSPTERALNDISRAWDRLVDNLARGAVGRITLQVVEGALSGAASLAGPSAPSGPRDLLGDAQTVLESATERLQRFDAETQRYRDPDAEVVIPGFGFGSPRALRAQLQAQLESARSEVERQRLTAPAALATPSTPTQGAASTPRQEALRIGEDTARQVSDLGMRQRVYGVAPSQRPIVEAEIQAETAARERNLNSLEAEALRRAMVTDAAAQQRVAYQDQARELDIQSRGSLAVAEAYAHGQAEAIRADAARQAALESFRTGVDATARAEDILRGRVAETAEAQARAAFQAQASADSARRLADAEEQGSSAVLRAETAERALNATRDARAALANASGEAEQRLRAGIDATTRAIEEQDAAERRRQLTRERRTAANDVEIARMEANAAGQEDPDRRRAAELAIDRERRMQAMRERYGDVDQDLLANQDRAAELREQARFFSDVRDQARSLASDISEFLVDGFANADQAGRSVFSNLADGAVGLFRRAAARIAATLIEQKFILPITTQIVGAVPSLFGVSGAQAAGQAGAQAASSGGGFFDWIGDLWNSVFGSSTAAVGAGHAGALIGIAPSHLRRVALDDFLSVPRFHLGGMLGLRPNEVPFLGLKGEEVLTRDDPRHRWNLDRLQRAMPAVASGGDVQVNVYDMRVGRDQAPTRAEQRRGADGRREIAVFIEEKIEDAVRSGRLDRAQGETFGMRRMTKRV
jgi:hypothetical protein